MTSCPVKVAAMSPSADDDKVKPRVTSIIVTRDDKLVMADSENSKIKVAQVNPPAVTATLTLDKKPWDLALLSDGGVAATTGLSNTIYLLKVDDDAVTVTSRFHPEKDYWGIAGHSDGSLIVSCEGFGSNYCSSVDLISRDDGRLLRTVVNSRKIRGLNMPTHLTFLDDQVLVSDWAHDDGPVYRVKVETGELMDTYVRTELDGPQQICADSAGNIFIASFYGQCVLAKDKRDQWRVLLTAEHDGEEGYSHPAALCVTSTGQLVVGWRNPSDTRLVIYEMR